MKGKIKRKTPEIVLKNGKPSAVIMDIKDYREILERLEDTEDLKMLDDMRKKPLKFKKFGHFLNEVDRSV